MSQELVLAPLGRAVVTASALRLRETPDPLGLPLSSVPRASVVEVLGLSPDGKWTQVRAGRRVGWMASKYLVAVAHPLAPSHPREEFPWMVIALAELGVSETAGEASTPRVLQYLASTSLERGLAGRDSTPWCSGFVNWCVETAGLAGTDSASARSWLGWGRAIGTPRRGCVVVLSRQEGGHVGFFVKEERGKSWLLGGNQGDRVSIAAYESARVLGCRAPS